MAEMLPPEALEVIKKILAAAEEPKMFTLHAGSVSLMF